MRQTTLCAAACCALAAAIAGCGQRPDYSKYIPAVDTAQAALETALAAWRSGQTAPLRLTDPDVAVEIIDAQRKPGQRLVGFEIQGEESAEGPRCFVVRLDLENPADTLQVRYYVLGLDPLWIFRQEDYDMVNHWDCEMPGENLPASSAPAAADATGGAAP